MENFNTLTSGGIVDEDLIQDGWTEIIRNLISMANYRGKGLQRSEIAEMIELADFQKMEQVRARAQEVVNDPDVAESLKPYYRQFCKRPCFHDDYLPTFNRGNVHLIDTDGKGIDEITGLGVVANGELVELDCIIFATGFEVGTDYTRRSGYDLIGKGGVKLSDKWAEGMRSLHGLHTRGFPNLFIISNAQAAFTTNFPHAMDESAQHIAYIVNQCLSDNISSVEPSEEAEEAWVQEIISLARLSESYQASCTPGYYNNEGKPDRRSVQNASYGRGPGPFFKRMKAWREKGGMEGLEFS
jgi:cyclohexanone monooxygenase